MLIVGVHYVRLQLESTTHDLRYTIRVLRRDDSRETDAHLHSARDVHWSDDALALEMTHMVFGFSA